MTVLENLLVAQHNKLMKASGFTILGLLGIGTYGVESKAAVEKARFWLEKADLVDRADDPAGDLPYGAQRRLEICACHVHRSRSCSASTNLPRASIRSESQVLNTLLRSHP